MDCRIAQQLITDAVTGDLSDEQRQALVAHCDQCAACRSELQALRAVWDQMGHSRVPPPAADLNDRFAQRLARQPAVGWVRPRSLAVAASLAMLLMGGMGGFAAGRWTASPPPAATPESVSPAYLLLLYGATEAPGLNQTQLIAEYVAWARELEGDGRLIDAHRLAERVGTVVQGQSGAELGPVTTADANAVSGFFLIRAEDMGRALEVALEGPHARYGGRVEVRPIAQ